VGERDKDNKKRKIFKNRKNIKKRIYHKNNNILSNSLIFFINSFIKYGVLIVVMSIFCFPVIFLFYLRFILKCSYEILIIKKM